MPLLDDLASVHEPRELARRRFLGWLGTGALGAAGASLAIGSLRFLEPAVEYREERVVVVAQASAIAPNTVVVADDGRVYIVRNEQGFFALSAICTHLGCATRYESETQGFFCPCHGSRFAADGAVLEGPAPRALRRLHLSIEGSDLVVDANRVVEDDALVEVT